MGKMRTQERIRAGEDTIGLSEDRVVQLFRQHYEFARDHLTREHAAANAHDAVQRHLASSREGRETERSAEQKVDLMTGEEFAQAMREVADSKAKAGEPMR